MIAHDDSLVLLVDDDENFRAALADNLREDGYTVLEYASPGEVPALPTLARVRLVITDYQMPAKDGVAFADAFHGEHPSVPIVLITANQTLALQAQIAARSFVHLHWKSFDYSDLRALLQRLMRPEAA